MLSQIGTESNSSSASSTSGKRRHQRFSIDGRIDWDFFTESTGKKQAFLVDASESGCLIRTNDLIEHRRWIRILLKTDLADGLWFTAVGRIVRREERMEAQTVSDLTLYRYGIEMIQPLHPMVVEHLASKAAAKHASQFAPQLVVCSICGNGAAEIPDLEIPGKMYCALCHLRQTCTRIVNEHA